MKYTVQDGAAFRGKITFIEYYSFYMPLQSKPRFALSKLKNEHMFDFFNACVSYSLLLYAREMLRHEGAQVPSCFIHFTSGRGMGGNSGVILVRVCEPVF